jgi:hypothetical protein
MNGNLRPPIGRQLKPQCANDVDAFPKIPVKSTSDYGMKLWF